MTSAATGCARPTARHRPPFNGVVSWAYDAADRMTGRTADGLTVSYGYNAVGNQTSAQGPAGRPVNDIDPTGQCGPRPASPTPTVNPDHTEAGGRGHYAAQCSTWRKIWGRSVWRGCIVHTVLWHLSAWNKAARFFAEGIDLAVLLVFKKPRGKYDGTPPQVRRTHDRRLYDHARRNFYALQVGVQPASRWCSRHRRPWLPIAGAAGAAYLFKRAEEKRGRLR